MSKLVENIETTRREALQSFILGAASLGLTGAEIQEVESNPSGVFVLEIPEGYGWDCDVDTKSLKEAWEKAFGGKPPSLLIFSPGCKLKRVK